MENNLNEGAVKELPAREIGIITLEIKELCRQAKATALMYIVEIGRRLCEAKASLPYGKFGEWLKNEVNFSQSAAGDYMKLFEEYGSTQITLFGASVESQTFANLPYTKALQLLALPREEREAFAEEVDAENLSVRKLKEAIAERKRAEEERDEAIKNAARQEELKKELETEYERRLTDAALKAEEDAAATRDALARAEEDAAATRDALTKAERERAEAREALSKAEEKMDAEFDELRRKLSMAESAKAEAEKATEELKNRLSEAEANPDVPEEKLTALRAELTEAIKKEADAANAEALLDAKRSAEAADAKVLAAKMAEKQAMDRLAEMEKRLKVAGPEVASFKALFESLQDTVSRMRTILDKLRTDDSDTANRLTAALRAFADTLVTL